MPSHSGKSLLNDVKQQERYREAQEGFPIDYVAEFLTMRGAKPVSVIMSPTGDDGSTATVMLARAMSELGRSVVLVDMSASGAPTRLMSADTGLAGILDLLVGDAAFGETIHHDRLSNAHIVPQGIVRSSQASRIRERLTMVVGALSGTYDSVLLEFGAAEASDLNHILKHIDAELVLSLPQGDKQVLRDALTDLEREGYRQVIPMVNAPRRASGET